MKKLNNKNYQFIIEKEITEYLFKHNIKCVHNFKLPSFKDTEIEVDLAINYPIRALIEIKNILTKSQLSIFLKRIKRTFSYMEYRYNSTYSYFIILLTDRFKVPEVFFKKNNFELNIIYIPDNIKNKSLYAANKIKKKVINELSKYKLIIKARNKINKDDFISKSNFRDYLLPILPYINENEREFIFKEINQLEAEVNSNHFTCAALRIGRTIEYLFYCLGRGWNIDMNNYSVKIIDELNHDNNVLKNIILDYFYADNKDKDNKRKILEDKTGELAKKIVKLGYRIDNIHEPEVTGIPIVVNAIIREIGKKYNRIPSVAKITHDLNKSEEMSFLLKVRNNVAHARASKDQKDIKKEDINRMVNALNKIIEELVSIAILIKKND